MPSPNTLERNARLKQAYKKLSSKKAYTIFNGVRVSCNLSEEQKLQVLAKVFFLAPRTIENLLGMEE